MDVDAPAPTGLLLELFGKCLNNLSPVFHFLPHDVQTGLVTEMYFIFMTCTYVFLLMLH